MANPKMNRKGQVSITVIVMTMLVGFAVMYVGIDFLGVGQSEYNATLNPQQEQAFEQLQNAQIDLDNDIQDTKGNASDLDLQEGFAFWNAFKGLGNAVLLPLNIINVGTNSVSALITGTDNSLPVWVQTLISLAVIALIALVILSALTGGNSKI